MGGGGSPPTLPERPPQRSRPLGAQTYLSGPPPVSIPRGADRGADGSGRVREGWGGLGEGRGEPKGPGGVAHPVSLLCWGELVPCQSWGHCGEPQEACSPSHRTPSSPSSPDWLGAPVALVWIPSPNDRGLTPQATGHLPRPPARGPCDISHLLPSPLFSHTFPVSPPFCLSLPVSSLPSTSMPWPFSSHPSPQSSSLCLL